MERSNPNNTFVVFQFGDGNTENIMLNLPSVLLANNPTNNPSSTNETTNGTTNGSTTASTSTTTPTAPTTSTTAPSNNRDGSSLLNNENSNLQRDMLVSVSYTYSHDNSGANNAQGRTAQGPQTSNDAPAPDSRAGSVMLSVPNIPPNGNDAQFSALIEFAASIALTAIAVSGMRRNNGITKEIFESFQTKLKSELNDKNCPICFEEYLESNKKTDDDNKKRKREEEEDDESSSHKARKSEVDSRTSNTIPSSESATTASTTTSNTASTTAPSTASASESSSASTSASGESTASPSTTRPASHEHQHSASEGHNYTHIPVELPCKHTFGQDCLYEWLKSNSTCPLCRQVVHEEATQGQAETINLPNITSLLNRGTRERPTIIFFDRTTNTLTTRPTGETGQPDRPASSVSTSSESNTAPRTTQPNFEDEPLRILGGRSSFASGLLSRLNRVTGTDSIFSSGVASRRTNNGVETVNMDNNSQNEFENFYEESRRLVQERLSQVSGRSSGLQRNTQSNNNDDDNNEEGEEGTSSRPTNDE